MLFYITVIMNTNFSSFFIVYDLIQQTADVLIILRLLLLFSIPILIINNHYNFLNNLTHFKFEYIHITLWSIGKLNSRCPIPLTGTYYCKDSGWK